MNKPETVAIEVGKRYEFVSEVEEEYLPSVERLRNYTGQEAIVLSRLPDDPERSTMYIIRFDDGREIHAYEEELSGWDKALGQFFGPSGIWGDPS